MKGRKGSQFLGPIALAFLQECFEVLLVRHDLDRHSADADIIATALLEAYENGVTDKFELMRVVNIQADLRRTG